MPSNPSTKLFLIEQHYASMRDELEWTPPRVNRLCAALQITVDELAAFIRVRQSHMRQYMERGTFPGPVELHLLLIERAALPNSKPPVFPVLS